jgi:hypothetical protein
MRKICIFSLVNNKLINNLFGGKSREKDENKKKNPEFLRSI